MQVLKVIYHPLYSMNNFVTSKSKLPQDGAQVFPSGVIGYHVILWEGHMIANHPIQEHNYSYHIRGDISPLTMQAAPTYPIKHKTCV